MVFFLMTFPAQRHEIKKGILVVFPDVPVRGGGCLWLDVVRVQVADRPAPFAPFHPFFAVVTGWSQDRLLVQSRAVLKGVLQEFGVESQVFGNLEAVDGTAEPVAEDPIKDETFLGCVVLHGEVFHLESRILHEFSEILERVEVGREDKAALVLEESSDRGRDNPRRAERLGARGQFVAEDEGMRIGTVEDVAQFVHLGDECGTSFPDVIAAPDLGKQGSDGRPFHRGRGDVHARLRHDDRHAHAFHERAVVRQRPVRHQESLVAVETEPEERILSPREDPDRHDIVPHRIEDQSCLRE